MTAERVRDRMPCGAASAPLTRPPRRRSPAGALAALIVCALALTGCVGLPASGPVNRDTTGDAAQTAPELLYRPDRPAPGATPEAIVQGFIQAATSPSGNWEIAQLFLAPSFREQWKPEAGVTIDASGSRRIERVEEGVQVALSVVADVDATGAYRSTEDGAPTEATLGYALAQQADGEWRITRAPDGIVLDASDFQNVFHAYALMFFDPGWTYLVPDVRWFPYRTATTSRIVRELVEGAPSPWLAGAVASAFPDDVILASNAVPLTSDGIASVDLEAQAPLAGDETVARMQRQLIASLQSAAVTGVDLRIDGSPVTTTPASVGQQLIDPRPLIGRDGAVGFFSGGEVEALPAIGGALAALDPRELSLGRGQTQAAALTRDGRVVRVSGDGFVRLEDQRPGLIAPVIDPAGLVWSVEASAPGGLRATAPSGTVIAVQQAFPEATGVRSIAMSRDGARLAAVITIGNVDWVAVSSVLRSESGIALGETQLLGTLGGEGVDLAWIGELSLGVLVRGDTGLLLRTQPVGGPSTSIAAPAGATVVAAGASENSPRVFDGAGRVLTRRGTTWQQTATDVRLLGNQMGVG